MPEQLKCDLRILGAKITNEKPDKSALRAGLVPEQPDRGSKFHRPQNLFYLSGGRRYPATDEGYAQMRRDEQLRFQPTVHKYK